MGQLAAAFSQVMRTGSPDQHTRAHQVLTDARRALYQILADGPEPQPAGGDADAARDEPVTPA